MPYKDPQRKREWERHHRLQRLTRRRELRRISIKAAEPSPPVIALDESRLLWFAISATAILILAVLRLMRTKQTARPQVAIAERR